MSVTLQALMKVVEKGVSSKVTKFASATNPFHTERIWADSEELQNDCRALLV